MSQSIVIFASGEGTNAENIITYFKDSKHQVNLVITNNPKAGVIERARIHNIPVEILNKERLNSSSVLLNILTKYNIDFLVLSGFLLKIPSFLVHAFPRKIINIHPALLPDFGGKGMYGMHVHKAVIEAGIKESGITIHYVNENYDEGAIIFQAKCTVSNSDTAETLANKIHALEYSWFPRIIDQILSGKTDFIAKN